MQNCEAQVNDFLYKQTNEKEQSMKHKTVGSRIHVNAPICYSIFPISIPMTPP